MKPKILIAHSEIPKSALTIFDNNYELIFSEGSPYPSRETLLKDIRGVDAAFWFGHVHVDQEMIDAAGGQLKVVGVMSAGYDHINVKLLKERNILVSNAPNVLSSAVADMSVGLALAVSRNLLQGYNAILSNKWVINHPTWMCGPTLEGSTVGIVGMGDIGCKIAQRIKSFDIGKLLYHNRSPRPEATALGAELVSLDELLSESDFVFIIVPLRPETKHLFNMEKFKKMKPTSILINTSRGDVVHQEDLVEALQKKIIWGAGLDVTTPEPLPHGHPLTTLTNVVLTPHISSATWKARGAMAKLAADNIWNALNNKPLLTPIN